MKEHGSESSAEMSAKSFKSLKSLLKKPGQQKPKSQKNRVVINEKLNEFFAADYIILIKEECCADYEEECDCCCQEHEMIRLGNCKECRAELNLQFASSGGRIERDPGNGGHEQAFNEEVGTQGLPMDDSDSCGSAEGGVPPSKNAHHHHQHQQQQREEPQRQQPAQQQETLSPPEGYKDLCDEVDSEESNAHQQPVCAECNSCYHQQSTVPDEQPEANGINPGDGKSGNSHDEDQVARVDFAGDTNHQAQQTTPDVHQRYLVETITMTTVTERRIVRELSGEESTNGDDEADNSSKRVLPSLAKNRPNQPATSYAPIKDDPGLGSEGSEKNEDDEVNGNKSIVSGCEPLAKDTPDAGELSLSFKLPSASLVSNSLKPNSAVRQLFPDPRFISPPPAPNKTVVSAGEDPGDSENGEGQKFLITTESLRLFDAVKRSKGTGSRDEDDGQPTTIRKTIERNALRRSLICKYAPNPKKKNLRSKEFTLEERIRQLTCMDLDERDTESSASENTTTGDSSDYLDFPVRTSPSGEEAKGDTLRGASTTPMTSVVSTISTSQQEYNAANPSPQGSHHNSTYRKITDLFGQKKIEAVSDISQRNLPDLGIGNRLPQAGKEFGSKNPVAKMNSDARKQFLASLTPLSCVAGTGLETREDYYQLSSAKITTTNGGRDSVSYNSDSSYSLEDIEAALRGEECNYRNAGPPDVTRGTPTSVAGDDDSATDELQAFVEQDKTRTERIKKRYNDAEEQHDPEEEDDELNDYGFNRRPSVRGIKPKFGSTNEILRQLQSRSVAGNGLIEAGKPGSHLSWPSYRDNESDKARLFVEEEEDAYQTISDGHDNNTINRINTMQRQIDDIYQTIAETAGGVQGTHNNRGSSGYLESTLPRSLVRVPVNGDCQRYSDQTIGTRLPEQQHPLGSRMLRIAGGGDSGSVGHYNTLPIKSRRHPVAAVSSAYQCEVVPPPESKCYRTMYLLPYNGLADPTYQNIQRILPPHASPNYTEHVERYPYPRNARKDLQGHYYARPLANTATAVYSQSALHLHLHQPPDEIRVPNTLPFHHGVHSLPLQHHAHQIPQQQQTQIYNGSQPIPYPTTTTPMRGAGPGGGYQYQMHLGRSAADVQTQTITGVPTSNSGSPLCAYNTGTVPGSGVTNILSSPTKMQQQRSSCTVAERGVPEGAASAPSHDFQSNQPQIHPPSSHISHQSNVPPPNTQNSVYYAMNV